MHIKPGRAADLPALVAVREASVRGTHDFLSEADIRCLRPLILHRWLPAVDLHRLRDARDRIHGFLGVDGDRPGMRFRRPESRGGGLGRRLVRFVLEEPGVRRVDINEQNPAARGFHEHPGFTMAGRSATDGMGNPFPLLHLRRNDHAV